MKQLKTVLITGGSSGIGYEMSRHFARGGYRLLWVSKPPQELADAKTRLETEIAGVMIDTLAKDLSEKGAAREVYDWAKNIATMDVLINNAGFGTYGFTQDISVEKDMAMIDLHISFVYQMTRLFLDDMLARNAGTIINISSITAFQPITRMNTYASTKAFIHHFSRGLQEELTMQKSQVKVVTVCPAAIGDTPFKTTGNMADVKTFKGLVTTTAEEVGSDVWKGFNAGKTYIVSGAKMRRLNLISGLLPYWFKQYLIRRESERA